MEKLTLNKAKANLLISVSGGETSVYMAWWLWTFKRDEYNMVFVFANTGLELYETAQFIARAEYEFGFIMHWLEPFVYHDERKSTGYLEVKNWLNLNFEGKPFDDMCKKYGLPNPSFKHCSRELKENPIRAFGKDYFGGEEYYTAIGIREDEFDRMSVYRKEKKIIYPLISMRPMTKKKINFWWSQQKFRLELKGYEGNCTFCWKKGERKLLKLFQERPYFVKYIYKIEQKYQQHYPSKEPGYVWKDENGWEIDPPKLRMFRGHKSVHELEILSKTFDGEITDENDVYNDEESCEVFAMCGIDN